MYVKIGAIPLSGNRRAREKHQGLERPNGMQLECHHACDAERQLLQHIVSFFDRLAVPDEYDDESWGKRPPLVDLAFKVKGDRLSNLIRKDFGDLLSRLARVERADRQDLGGRNREGRKRREDGYLKLRRDVGF